LTVGGRERGKHLFAMDLDIFGGRNAQADLVAPDFENSDHDVVADHDALVHMPRQYQQSSLLPWAMSGEPSSWRGGWTRTAAPEAPEKGEKPRFTARR
jgi:hypothetical protein